MASPSGAGAEITTRLARGATAGDGFNAINRDPGLRTAMETTVLNLIAPWTRPYRLVTVPTDLRAVDVERRHVAVQMLAVGVDPQLGVVLLPERAIAGELRQVGEHPDQRDLARQDVAPCGKRRVAGSEIIRQHLL